MPVLEKLNVGLVGAAGRGGDFRTAFECNGARIHAVCDIRKDKLADCARLMDAAETYADYAEMIRKSLSNRPHAMTNYQLQGTDGACESSRNGPGDRHKIWLRALNKETRWLDLDELIEGDSLVRRRMPLVWRRPPPEARCAGHGGGDFYEVRDFVRAVQGKAPCPVGIHETMDMTLPGLVSQQSIKKGGAWLNVPDSRDWK